jgi:hypothetical protein
MFINQSALPTDMPYVAVLKAIGPRELEMASRGKIPGDLGGGMFGARGVPRGYPSDDGSGLGGVGRTPPSELYFERMRGGADVPAHQMAREAEGRPPIPHSGREPQARGGGGLMGAMRRQGINPRQWYEGTGNNVQGGVPPGRQFGVMTAQIPGRVEAAPHELRHAEMARREDLDDVLDNLAASFEQRSREPRNVQTSSQASVRDRARTSAEADRPQSTGSRRTEQ